LSHTSTYVSSWCAQSGSTISSIQHTNRFGYLLPRPQQCLGWLGEYYTFCKTGIQLFLVSLSIVSTICANVRRWCALNLWSVPDRWARGSKSGLEAETRFYVSVNVIISELGIGGRAYDLALKKLLLGNWKKWKPDSLIHDNVRNQIRVKRARNR
jgi:hypothetical protein